MDVMGRKEKFSWQEKEFIKKPKDKRWFLGFFIFFFVIIVVSLLFKSYFLAFLLLISSFSFFVYALKEPLLYTFTIDKNGFTINKEKIPFENVSSFWIFKKEPAAPNEISLNLKKKISNNIKIPIAPNQDTEKIRKFLKKYIREKRQEESLIEALLERVGF